MGRRVNKRSTPIQAINAEQAKREAERKFPAFKAVRTNPIKYRVYMERRKRRKK